MRDVLFLLLTVGFFGVASAAVGLCDRIVGPDPVIQRADERVEGRVSADDAIGLVLALLVAAYLVVALVWPERF